MFIHWGVYSVRGVGECFPYRGRIPFSEYREYAKRFRAEKYDPDSWARLAKEAGMKYMVLTSKHLEGFCLFQTETTDFCAPKSGSRRDLVREYVNACRRNGLKVGLYYNLRDFSSPAYDYDPKDSRWKPYVDRVHAQIKELLTNYGRIDLFWIDQSSHDPVYEKGLRAKKLGRMIYRLQPECVVTRVFGKEAFGLYTVYEQNIVGCDPGVPFESCDTFNKNWGYHGLDKNWKTVEVLARNIATCAHHGGNYLLNVGPKADGTIPPICQQRLRELGRWTHRNAEALYDVEPHPFNYADQTLSTGHNKSAYIFLVPEGAPARNRPADGTVIAGIGNRVLTVTFLANGTKIPFHQKGDRLELKPLPKKMPDRILPVIKLGLDGKPKGRRDKWWHCGR